MYKELQIVQGTFYVLLCNKILKFRKFQSFVRDNLKIFPSFSHQAIFTVTTDFNLGKIIY